MNPTTTDIRPDGLLRWPSSGGQAAGPRDSCRPMSLNARSAFRIAALLVVATGCAWSAGQYLDVRSFEERNADAMAVCSALTPGMPVAEAGSRARAVVVTESGRLMVEIPGQSPCVVETVGDRVRSAAMARNG